ncbi:MAG: nucleoside hydrolase [Thermoproteota archaeon]
MVKSIVLDTDIGDDIDDAFALLFALKCRELNLKAVTVVYGDVESRAKLASKLISSIGLKIPVAIGASKSLLGFAPSWKPPQAEVLEEESGEYLNLTSLPAWDVIAESVLKTDGLKVVSIGPLTNIALTLLLMPEVKEKLNLVSMAGFFNGSGAEYNVKCDPEALNLVLKSGVNPLLVGLDVTLKCTMPMSMVERLGSSDKPEHKLVYSMLEAWRKNTNSKQPILHDPLALATVVDNRIVSVENARVDVELKGDYTRGFTVVTGSMPNASICLEVDVERFLKLFEEVIFS